MQYLKQCNYSWMAAIVCCSLQCLATMLLIDLNHPEILHPSLCSGGCQHFGSWF